MTRLRIEPGRLSGRITPPPAKSDAHRAMIAAFLAGTELPEISGLGTARSADLIATERCLNALREGRDELDCGESGTTLRLLLSVVAALPAERRAPTVVFRGSGRLPERPLGDLIAALRSGGALVETPADRPQTGGNPSHVQPHALPHLQPTPPHTLPQTPPHALPHTLPLTLSGRLRPGTYRISGNVSSQYCSGLLMALPLLDGSSRVVIEGTLESAPYVAMTVRTLRAFCVRIDAVAGGFAVPGGQRYRWQGYRVERDWSQAAFWLAAAFAGSDVQVDGLSEDTAQGDRRIAGWLDQLAASESGSACVFDIRDTPDLAPILAVAASFRPLTTTISGCARLRYKESDRLEAVVGLLAALGADAEAAGDSIVVRGRPQEPPLVGGAVDAGDDHRLAMAAAIAALRTAEGVTLGGAEAVNKSYPNFFDEFIRLGGCVHGLDLGT